MARNKINDLRDHLFETLERLKDGDIDIATAKAMADVGQVIINSAKLEVDFIRVTGSNKDSGFIKLGDGNGEYIRDAKLNGQLLCTLTEHLLKITICK